MDTAEIMRYLKMVGEELETKGTRGDIVLAGGAVMLLVVKSRQMTKDVDAYLGEHPETIRAAARKVAAKEGLNENWLNDGVKGFFYGTPPQLSIADFPGLRVYSVTPEYMIAMKTMAGRPEDIADLKQLVSFIGIDSAEQVLKIVEEYVPERLLTTRVQYVAESLFDDEPTHTDMISVSGSGTASSSGGRCSSRCRTSNAPASKCRCSCGGKNHGSQRKKF